MEDDCALKVGRCAFEPSRSRAAEETTIRTGGFSTCPVCNGCNAAGASQSGLQLIVRGFHAQTESFYRVFTLIDDDCVGASSISQDAAENYQRSTQDRRPKGLSFHRSWKKNNFGGRRLISLSVTCYELAAKIPNVIHRQPCLLLLRSGSQQFA